MSERPESQEAKRDGDRRRRFLHLLLLLLLLGGIGFAAWKSDWRIRHAPSPQGKPPATPAVQSTLIRPSFDIVRAEPTGELVAAGRAEPNAEVRVLSNGEVIGTTKADEHGEWVFQPTVPLKPGAYTISLEAALPGRPETVESAGEVAISVAGTGEKPLVAVTEADKPTRVLQLPEEEKPEQASADDADSQEKAPSASESPAAAPDEVAITTADYEEKNGSGTLLISGTAPAGRMVGIYIDNELAGSAKSDEGGNWSLKVNQKLSGKSYAVRADLADTASGKVAARAEIDFQPAPPEEIAVKEEPKVAEAARQASAANESAIGSSVGAQQAAKSESAAAEPPAQGAGGKQAREEPERTEVARAEPKPSAQPTTEVAPANVRPRAPAASSAEPSKSLAAVTEKAATPAEQKVEAPKPAATSPSEPAPARTTPEMVEAPRETVARKTTEGTVAPPPVREAAPERAPSQEVAAAGTEAGSEAADTPAARKDAVAGLPGAAAPEAATARKPVARAAARKRRVKRRRGRRVITIRRGDTLWDIATRHYGKGYRYTRIYRSNKGQIRNPNLIYPRQRIILPK